MQSTPPEIPELQMVDILGSKVHLIQSEQAVDYVEYWIAQSEEQPKTIVVTGFHGLHVANEDPEFRNIINDAELFIPDGIAPVWIARMLGKNVKGRATGAELMRCFFERANEKGYKSFFFGDTDETLAALHKKLKKKYPGHKTVGVYSPPFRQHSEEEKKQMIEMINDAEPDVLWVGLGLPKQERWIHENKNKLNVPVAIGVGAAFGFHSGQVKRVPEWIGNAGFEWVWRFFAEPQKLWHRDIIEGPGFLLTLARQWRKIKKDNYAT